MTLADRIEALDGPSREIDAEIAVATGEYKHSQGSRGALLEVATNYTVFGWPMYTASVDAALTLVPEGWSHGYCWNKLHQSSQAHCELIPEAPFNPEELITGHSGKCKTLPLAICAAALRAREAG